MFGDRIKQLRKEKEWSQEYVANKLNISVGALSRYETGMFEPKSLSLVKDFATLFNVTTDYLLGNSDFKTYDEELEFSKEYLSKELDIPKEVIQNSLRYPKTLTENEIQVLNDIEKAKYSDNFNIYSYLENLDDSQKEHIINAFNTMENANRIITEAINRKNSIDNLTKTSDNLFLVPVLGKIAAGQPILAEEYIEGYLPVDPNVYGLKTSNDLFYLRVSGQSMNLKIKNGDYALIRKQDTAEDGDIIVAIVNSDNEATLKRYRKLNDYTVRLEPMSTDTSIEEIEVDLRSTNLKIIGKAIGQFGKF